MSIYGALFSGVSGLSAQSQALGVIADNISNVNTIGYKASRANFSTLVTQNRGTETYTPGGVSARPQALIDRQGLLQASGSATDIAISGNGFFVVNEAPDASGNYAYTRAGSFTTDAMGFLRSTSGYYLQGWPIDSNGNIPANRSDLTALTPVNVNSLTGSAEATTAIALRANLQSSQTPAAYTAGDMSLFNASAGASGASPHFERSLDIFDSKGGAHTVTFGFFRDAALPANQWRVEAYVEDPSEVTAANGLLSSGILAFNDDGSFDAGSTTFPTTLTINNWAPALGIANSSIALNLGSDGLTDGITQFDSSSVLTAEVNGAVFGALSGVAIDDAGFVTALFENGSRQAIYKLPIATFPNPEGLEAVSGNVWAASGKSGSFALLEAGVGGAGQISPSALEASTVDLASEFATMITTQRAYSASSRIITTANEMLDELIRVIR